jgi:hypothetical protein
MPALDQYLVIFTLLDLYKYIYLIISVLDRV